MSTALETRIVALLSGLSADDVALIRQLVRERREWEDVAASARTTANELAAELAAAHDTITTQGDALRSVERALSAWRTVLAGG